MVEALYKLSVSLLVQWVLLAAVLVATLFAGLSPKDFQFKNKVAWLGETPGVSISDYGVIYSTNFLSHDKAAELNASGFTIEIAFELNRPYQSGVNLLVQFYSGYDHSQLIIGHWQNTIIVMNGNDYAYLRKEPRVEANFSDSVFTSQLLSLSSDQTGTRLYLNGELQSDRPNLILSLPETPPTISLILGNSVFGDAFIEGSIFGFAVYEESHTEATVKAHHRRWRAENDFSFASEDKVYAYYLLEEGKGEKISDYAQNGGGDLIVPGYATPLVKRLFVNPFQQDPINLNFIIDVAINLFGFIPFGFMVAVVLLSHRPNAGGMPGLLIVMVLGLVFSFGIEFLQTWIPSRNSSLLDLALNSLGAFIGAALFRMRPWLTLGP